MRKHLDILLTLIITLIVTVAMLWPVDKPSPALEGSDKLVHIAAFVALAFPLSRTDRVSLLHIFMGASAFGGMIELIQPTFDRSADINDWIADILGVVLGIVLGLIYRRVRQH